MKDGVQSTGAVALVTSGIGAAFVLATCCALPIMLGGYGLTAYWLAPVGVWGERLGTTLTAVSILTLAAAALIIWRAPKTCAPASLCARPWFRVSITVLAAAGVVLLILSKVYA